MRPSNPPCVTLSLVVAPLRGLDGHPFFPSHVASGRCVLSAAAAGALAGVISAFAEPRRWCAGAVLNVAGAVCASAVPSSYRIGGCAGCCGGCLTVFATHTPPPPCGRPPPASPRFRVHEAQHPPCVTFRQVVASLRGPGRSPVLPFACCVGALRSVGRCGRCSCWCRFRVRGAPSLVCRGCAGCGGCRLCVSGAQ